jgi:hypothetical protein
VIATPASRRTSDALPLGRFPGESRARGGHPAAAARAVAAGHPGDVLAALVGVALTAVLLAVTLVIVATAAGAQTTTTPGVPAPPAGSDEAFNAGGIVFLVVSAVLIIGALTLYLRHRPARVADRPGA